MRPTLFALSFAAGVAAACGGSAIAAPAAPAAVQQAQAATSPLERAQFAERRTRHGVVKCYRTLVVGPYRCHHFRNGVIGAPF